MRTSAFLLHQYSYNISNIINSFQPILLQTRLTSITHSHRNSTNHAFKLSILEVFLFPSNAISVIQFSSNKSLFEDHNAQAKIERLSKFSTETIRYSLYHLCFRNPDEKTIHIYHVLFSDHYKRKHADIRLQVTVDA